MGTPNRSNQRRRVVIAAVIGLAISGCGNDDGGGGSPATGATPEAGEDVAGSVSDDDLLVPREYLQGAWCDSDGDNWTIEGDTARLDDGSDGTAEFPLDLLFIDGPDVELVSQTDDEFVFGSGDDEVTFTRGNC